MKKKLAFFLAAIMAFTMTTTSVFAASGTITGAGDAVVISPSVVLEATLPTTRTFDFVLDPQGLINSDHDWDTGPKPIGEIEDTGEIHFNGFAPVFLNRSSVPVRLGVEFSITTDAVADGGVIPQTTSEAAFESDARRVYVAPLTGTTNAAAVSPAASTAFTPAGASLTTGAQTLDYVLTEAAFGVERHEPLTTPATFGLVRLADDHSSVVTAINAVGTSLQMSGYVNPNADWSGDVNMGITVRFAVTDVIPGDIPVEGTDAFGLRRVLTGPHFAANPSIRNIVDGERRVGFIVGNQILEARGVSTAPTRNTWHLTPFTTDGNGVDFAFWGGVRTNVLPASIFLYRHDAPENHGIWLRFASQQTNQPITVVLNDGSEYTFNITVP